MNPTLKTALDLVARGEGQLFTVGISEASSTSCASGGDLSYLIKLQSSGMGSGILLLDLAIACDQDVHVAIVNNFSDSTAGMTNRSSIMPAGIGISNAGIPSVYEDYNATTSGLRNGFHVIGNTAPGHVARIDMRDAPPVREYQGDGNDAMLIQVHSESGTIPVDGLELIVTGISWEAA